MKIEYEEKNFRVKSLKMIQMINGVIIEYEQQGFTLTLRQLYYQFVSRDFIPNTQASYKRLGELLNNARLAGLVDWDAIIDRTRNLKAQPFWNSPASIIRACANQFEIDLWVDQEFAVEVWIEKEALIGVIEPICNKLFVPFFACKGYVSQSEQWAAGRRFLERMQERNQMTIVIHLGDHDPSGIDMTRDNGRRLKMFSEFSCTIKRIALNIDQVKKYRPPPNPTKMTDSRSQPYVDKYGSYSWELDALEPRVISQLIEDEIKVWCDEDSFNKRKELSKKGRDKLRKVAKILENGAWPV